MGDKIALYEASDERDEGRWIASEVERLHRAGRAYTDFALFYRTNAQSRALEDMLMRAGVAYRIVGGTRFYDRAEIRDVMAYLKLVVNPSDDLSARRVINSPRRGIGKKSVDTINELASRESLTFLEACELSLGEDGLRPDAKRGVAQFVQLIKDARLFRGSLRDIVELVVERSGYLDALAWEQSEEAEGRIENVMEFFSVVSEFDESRSQNGDEDDDGWLGAEGWSGAAEGVGEYGADGADVGADGAGEAAENDDVVTDAEPAGSEDPADIDGSYPDAQLVRFMEWLSLRSDLDSLVEGSDYVTLMTVHSAKGLEFPVVFLAGMENGLFPHYTAVDDAAQMEEERRLAYVAITRARELLYLCHAQVRHIFGFEQKNSRSKFVDDIPKDVLKTIGVGSSGYSGVGQEKRGSRRGIYGSGSETETSGYTYGSGQARRTVQSPSLSSESRGGGGRDALYAPGDQVDHKVFGRGIVQTVDGDITIVEFERGGDVRKLIASLAPMVKISL